MDGGRRSSALGDQVVASWRRSEFALRCGAALFACAAIACGVESPQTSSASRAELTVGFPEATGDPELGIGAFAQLLSLEGLTILDIDGRALPRLAERWEWENDNLALRLHLRPGVFLHDDRHFDAPTAAAILAENLRRPRNLALYPSLSDIISVADD